MKIKGLFGVLLWLVLALPAYAFSTVDEQIDHYLGLLETGNFEQKREMLERLQWSGLTDPRLFDEIEKLLLAGYLNETLDENSYILLSHHARALGYSGDAKYRDSLTQVMKNGYQRKNRGHAKKALNEQPKFHNWNSLIAGSDISVEGKSVEVAVYMKMLDVDDTYVQRNAARAIYHERQNDADLLALMAKNLEEQYLKEGLDKQEQDTGAWFCKALGQNGGQEYRDLLSEVAQNTPYKKIRKYASKYTN